MIIECPQCKAKYDIPEDRVKGKSKLKCSRCQTVFEVMEAIEGKLALNLCLTDKKRCEFSRNCPVHGVWATAQAKVVEVLKKANFEDLARQKSPAHR